MINIGHSEGTADKINELIINVLNTDISELLKHLTIDKIKETYQVHGTVTNSTFVGEQN